MKRLKLIILFAAALLVILIIAMTVIQKAQNSLANLPRLYAVPEFTFVERSGQPFGLDQLKGKINVVDFIFTRCGGPCPLMGKSMSELYAAFSRSDKVQLVSITCDPDYDSLQVLQDYARELGVTDQRWVFVRGEKEEMKNLYEQGFKLAGELPYDHSTKLILVDGEGWIRGYYDYDDPIDMDLLKQHIAALVRNLP
ncbi:SCO family protein [Caldithrix abyssi]